MNKKKKESLRDNVQLKYDKSTNIVARKKVRLTWSHSTTVSCQLFCTCRKSACSREMTNRTTTNRSNGLHAKCAAPNFTKHRTEEIESFIFQPETRIFSPQAFSHNLLFHVEKQNNVHVEMYCVVKMKTRWPKLQLQNTSNFILFSQSTIFLWLLWNHLNRIENSIM